MTTPYESLPAEVRAEIAAWRRIGDEARANVARLAMGLGPVGIVADTARSLLAAPTTPSTKPAKCKCEPGHPCAQHNGYSPQPEAAPTTPSTEPSELEPRWYEFKKRDGWLDDDETSKEIAPFDATVLAFVREELAAAKRAICDRDNEIERICVAVDAGHHRGNTSADDALTNIVEMRRERDQARAELAAMRARAEAAESELREIWPEIAALAAAVVAVKRVTGKACVPGETTLAMAARFLREAVQLPAPNKDRNQARYDHYDPAMLGVAEGPAQPPAPQGGLPKVGEPVDVVQQVRGGEEWFRTTVSEVIEQYGFMVHDRDGLFLLGDEVEAGNFWTWRRVPAKEGKE